MRRQVATDRELAVVAGMQHGVVSRAQLRRLGLSLAAIDHRVRAGRLHVIHRGVYAIGHPVLSVEGRWMAAVLACGADAVLSHASAAAAWELQQVGSGAVHVTIPAAPGRARRRGIRLHRCATLRVEDTTVCRGIPITTVARTIIDLSRTHSDRRLEHVIDVADQRGLVDFRDLEPGNSSVAGWRVLRFTWSQITRRATWVAAACRVDGDMRRQLAKR
jgi:Transcriptional regulator, AbiEi antitoxin